MSSPDLGGSILAAWRTNNRITTSLIQQMPDRVWKACVPGIERRTVRTIAAHLHNARSRWIKTLGKEYGITRPPLVDLLGVGRRELVSALNRSSEGIDSLLALGLSNGGLVPASKAYVWRNLSLDVGHVLTYFVAHEAHHRGQIVMIARQLGCRLPQAVTNGLWWWKPVPGRGRRPGVSAHSRPFRDRA
jgi:uncharacterized damage-inducible protein DinB